MANVLGDEKKQQVLALGRLGWPLRRIEVTVRSQTPCLRELDLDRRLPTVRQEIVDAVGRMRVDPQEHIA